MDNGELADHIYLSNGDSVQVRIAEVTGPPELHLSTPTAALLPGATEPAWHRRSRIRLAPLGGSIQCVALDLGSEAIITLARG